jgi:hypothetical protein
MKRFVEGEERRQPTLLPECLGDFVNFVAEDSRLTTMGNA